MVHFHHKWARNIWTVTALTLVSPASPLLKLHKCCHWANEPDSLSNQFVSVTNQCFSNILGRFTEQSLCFHRNEKLYFLDFEKKKKLKSVSTLPQLCVSWTGSYRFWLSLLGSMCWEVCAAFSWLCKTDPSGRVHAIFKVQRHQSCPAGEADDASLNRSSWLILQQPPSHLPPPNFIHRNKTTNWLYDSCRKCDRLQVY